MGKTYRKHYFEEEDFEPDEKTNKRKEKGRRKSNNKQIIQSILDDEPDLIYM